MSSSAALNDSPPPSAKAKDLSPAPAKGCSAVGQRVRSIRTVFTVFALALVVVAATPPTVLLMTETDGALADATQKNLDSVVDSIRAQVQEGLATPTNALAASMNLYRNGFRTLGTTEKWWKVFLAQADACKSGSFGRVASASRIRCASSAGFAVAAPTPFFSVALVDSALYNDSAEHVYTLLSAAAAALPAAEGGSSALIPYVPESVAQACSRASTRAASSVAWSAVAASTVDSSLLVSLAGYPRNGSDSCFWAQLSLGYVSWHLHNMTIGKTGYAYVVDEGDLLVATSVEGTLVDAAGGRVASFDSSNSRIASVARIVRDQFKSAGAAGTRSFRAGGRYIATAQFSHEEDIRWSLVVAIPEDDFLAGVKVLQGIEIGIILLLLVVAVAVSIVGSAVVSGPLEKLTRCLDMISELELDKARRLLSIYSRSGRRFHEIHSLWRSTSVMLQSLTSFQKFIPKAVVKLLIESKQEAKLGMNPVEVTLFFSDIEDFSGHSARMPIQDLVYQSTEYMNAMTQIITQNEGTVDKFIGDAIMAFWNAPRTVAEHQLKACMAAVQCKKKLAEMRREWEAKGAPRFYHRIGLHCGEVFVGNMGSNSRFNYTAIGSTVTIAARLEPLNRGYGTEIIISDKVYENVKDRMVTRPLGAIQIKGSEDTFKIYELVDAVENAPPALCTAMDLFARAVEHLERREFESARSLLRQYTTIDGMEKDVYARDLVALCNDAVTRGVPESWKFVRYVHRRMHTTVGEVREAEQEYNQADLAVSKKTVAMPVSLPDGGRDSPSTERMQDSDGAEGASASNAPIRPSSVTAPSSHDREGASDGNDPFRRSSAAAQSSRARGSGEASRGGHDADPDEGDRWHRQRHTELQWDDDAVSFTSDDNATGDRVELDVRCEGSGPMRFRMRYFPSNASATALESRVVFKSVVEFEETSASFDGWNASDKEVSRLDIGSSGWQRIAAPAVQSVGGVNVTVFTVTFVDTRTSATLTLRLTLADSPYSVGGATYGPAQAKIDVELSGWAYKGNASYLALACAVQSSAALVHEWPGRDEDPENVRVLDGDVAMAFGWNRTVEADGVATAVVASTFEATTPDSESDDGRGAAVAVAQYARLTHFAIAAVQPKVIVWDPYLGVESAETASAAGRSVAVLLAAFASLLLSLL
eukprot:m51a1_g3621 putative adenylate cyclase 1 (1159) ;mRNA; r:91794-96595